MISVQNSCLISFTFGLVVVVVVVTVVAVAVLVAAAATMMSNKISLQGTRDQEQLHLLHSSLEHKSYSFWHYKVTVVTFHP